MGLRIWTQAPGDDVWIALIAACIAALLLFSSPACCEEAGVTHPSSDALSGEWKMRVSLEQAGFRPFARLDAELWSNVDGGLRTGTRWNTLLDFGFELDTGKLKWWQGGTFMSQIHWVENQSERFCFADYTGAANPVSGIIAADHFRVFNLYYRQAWRNDSVVIKVGQLAADDDFMRSDYAGLFINSSFGAMPSQVGTRLAACCHYSPPYPIYPVAGPGMFVAAKPLENVLAQVGVYDGQPGPDSPSNHGFDWGTHSHTGVGLFYEGGYFYSFEKHPGTFRLGGTYHSGLFDDYAKINAGVSDAAARGVYSFYAINDFALLSNERGGPALGVFWRGGISPQTDRSIVTSYVDAGLNWFAPLPCRDHDVAGIAFSYMKFGENFLRSGDSGGVASSEQTLELTYRARITRCLMIQSDTQFLFNPTVNRRSDSRQTATVLGLRIEVTF